MVKKIFRSQNDAWVGGVCGGLGDYLGVDSNLVRLFFVLLAIGGNGTGVLIYVLLWIILPREDQPRDATFQDTVRSGSAEIADRAQAMGEDFREMVNHPNPQAGLVVGAGLIIVGMVFLIENLHLPWLNWLDFDIIWPSLLILGGLALLIRHLRGG